jgi:hypothetical protein
VSIGLRETVPVMILTTGIVAVAQRVVQGEWSWTWMAYFWGGIVAFSVIGSALAGLFALIQHLTSGEKRAREKRLVSYPAHYFYVDSPGKQGPWNHVTVRLVPDFSIIETEYRLEALREIVDEALERLRRDAAPGEWVARLPGLFSRVVEQGYVLRGPSPGGHWHDPGPSAPPPPRAT